VAGRRLDDALPPELADYPSLEAVQVLLEDILRLQKEIADLERLLNPSGSYTVSRIKTDT